jgi:hypothetical protein
MTIDTFKYARAGKLLVSFEPMSPADPYGADPDVLLPQMTGGCGTCLGGPSAREIEWAQSNLPGSMGVYPNYPMTKVQDQSVINNNRSIICPSSGPQKFPLSGPDDSCDEFTFAASYQSGAMRGVTAPNTQCDAITSHWHRNTGSWTETVWFYQPSNICVRAHVPKRDNSAVGGKFGSMVVKFHILDGDAFWISVF